MNTDPSAHPNVTRSAPAGGPDEPAGYEPPRLTVLGSLAALTAGGDASDENDMFGSAGGSGVIP